MWDMHDGTVWWMVFMPISWALLIGLVVFLATRTSPSAPGRHEPPAETPREIARRRYASGEISEDEFHRILETLET